MPTVHLQHDVCTRAVPSERTMDLALMFGLPLDGTHTHTIVPPIELTLSPGEVVFITGTSGGGKSTLLRLIAEALPDAIGSEALPALPEVALVDALGHAGEGCHDRSATPWVVPSASHGDDTDARPTAKADRSWHLAPAPCMAPASLEQVCHWLSLAGLNDAGVMLRTPSQLSEGQRHRLGLAQAMALAQRGADDNNNDTGGVTATGAGVLLLDEFGSTLDRTTAFALARSVRRWVSKAGVCLVCATAHDDLLEPLAPDVLIDVGPGGVCAVHRARV